MPNRQRAFTVLVLAGVALSVGAGSRAGREIPFDVARIFFEFNSTDKDLGVQVLLDGED